MILGWRYRHWTTPCHKALHPDSVLSSWDPCRLLGGLLLEVYLESSVFTLPHTSGFGCFKRQTGDKEEPCVATIPLAHHLGKWVKIREKDGKGLYQIPKEQRSNYAKLQVCRSVESVTMCVCVAAARNVDHYCFALGDHEILSHVQSVFGQ